MRLRNPLASPAARTAVPALILLGLLAGCATTEPLPRRERAERVPPAEPAREPPRVYFYPTQGQGPEQQDRDRYECYNWAVKQTGFDPGRTLAPQERVAVVPARAPGENTISTAITGAIIGAIVSSPGHAAGGAMVGAAAGGLLGAAADNAQGQQSDRIVRGRGDARYEREATEYRRAMSACLEGRGYSVK
jgi:hypothetical protein